LALVGLPSIVAIARHRPLGKRSVRGTVMAQLPLPMAHDLHTRSNILLKLGTRTKAEAAAWAHRHGPAVRS
jgi:hypothetical protein